MQWHSSGRRRRRTLLVTFGFGDAVALGAFGLKDLLAGLGVAFGGLSKRCHDAHWRSRAKKRWKRSRGLDGLDWMGTRRRQQQERGCRSTMGSERASEQQPLDRE